MSDVPEAIRLEILFRLPVAPLLRLRCVSKSWKSLIDSDEFTKQHLDHSRKTNTKLSIILSGVNLCSADFDLLNQTNRATFEELPDPLMNQVSYCGGIEILGSCEGLLALKNEGNDDIIIWNPSVRRLQGVPCTSIEYSGYLSGVDVVYGFGYDVVRNDYNFVRIVRYSDDPDSTTENEVKVYSLNCDCWWRVPDFPYCFKYRATHGEFVNGALHWIVTRKVKPDTPGSTECFVGAFDLGTNEYRLMPLPKFASDGDTSMDLIGLGGSLSLTCHVNKDHVDLWVMKEYGVQESWSFLFTFDNSDFNFRRPIAYSKCGRKVLLGVRVHDMVLMWYDLDKKSTDDIPIVQMPLIAIDGMYTCLQSLVLLNDGVCDFDLVTNKYKKGLIWSR